MDEKSIRVSDNTHQRLVEFVVQNPVIKLNKFADMAINKMISEVEQGKILNLLPQQKQEHG